MISVRYFGDSVWGLISPRYDERLRQVCRSMPGLRWNQPTAPYAWSGYIDAVEAAARVLSGKSSALRPPGVFRDLGGYSKLREYQKQGVRWLCEHADTGALLADDLGLGKTIQGLRAAKALNRRTVIVCPAFVKGVWECAIEGSKIRKAPPGWLGVVSRVCEGTKPDARIVPAVRVIIINYDILHAWLPTLIPWIKGGTVVFDELQYVQGAKARRSVAARELAAAATYRIGLTGTPMQNRPEDLWNPIETIAPGRFGNLFSFRLRYCGAMQKRVAPEKVVWENTAPTNVKELGARLQHFMLRRLKSEVMTELPPRTRQVIPIAVAKRYRAPIEQALTDDAHLRRALELSADGKIPDAISMAIGHLRAGHNVIVFTHRRVVAEQISDDVRNVGLLAQWIHGGLTTKKRDAMVRALRDTANDSKRQPRLLACTIDSTAVGIDLSFADVAIFAELDWVPSKLVQAEGRLHRFGQQRPVLIQYLIGEGTIDELIAKKVIDKELTRQELGILSDDGLQEDLHAARKSGADALREMWQAMNKECA